MTAPSATTLLAFDRLIDAGARAREAARRRLLAAGLPPPDWYDVLTVLERKGPMRPRDMIATTGIEQYTMSRLVSRMIAAGLVESRACPEDRRGQIVQLTATGKSARAAMWPVFADAIAVAIEARLCPEERVHLAILLDKVA